MKQHIKIESDWCTGCAWIHAWYINADNTRTLNQEIELRGYNIDEMITTLINIKKSFDEQDQEYDEHMREEDERNKATMPIL